MGMLRGCFASSIVGIVGRRVQVAGRQAVAHFIVSVVIEPAVGVVRFFQSRQRIVGEPNFWMLTTGAMRSKAILVICEQIPRHLPPEYIHFLVLL
jgi:hypothetical protein